MLEKNMGAGCDDGSQETAYSSTQNIPQFSSSGKSNRGFAMGRHALSERRDDLYETPAVATEALLRVETLPHLVWEPSAGRGAIVNVLRAADHEVFAQDLVDYGIADQHARRDFLMELAAPRGCDCIVGNPPYKLASEFVEHGLRLCSRVIFLLRLTFIESERRASILENGTLRRMHVFANRLPNFHRDGWEGPKTSSAVTYCWFCWDRNHNGPTTIQRITWTNSQGI